MHPNGRAKFQQLATERVNRFRNCMLLVINLSDFRYKWDLVEVQWYFRELRSRYDVMAEEMKNRKIIRSNVYLEPMQAMPISQWSHGELAIKERFHALMVSRMNRAINVMNLLLNLVNRNVYSYGMQEVRQILLYMNRVMDITMSHFAGIGNFEFKEVDESAQEGMEQVMMSR